MAIRTRSGKTGDALLTKNFDAIDKAIADFPNPFYTESQVVSFKFTMSTLDQSLPHKLSGKHKYVIPLSLKSSGFVRIIEQDAASNIINTHVRIIADGACTYSVLVCR